MKQETATAIGEVFKVFEFIGNLFMPKGPPWDKESAEFKKNIRISRQYYIWRGAVLRRDNYACVDCGDDRKSQLEADHIKPFSLFPELRFAIDNGRTLCNVCHKKTETYGGKVKKWKRRK